MALSEKLSWSQADKPDKKDKETSDKKAKYVNPPIKGVVEGDLPLKRNHEGPMKMEEHVLPDILFQELLKGDVDRNKNTESIPHVPIPVEPAAPNPARAEHPVYDPYKAEQAARHTKPLEEGTKEFDDDDDDDEAAEEQEPKKRQPVEEAVVVPLEEMHEGAIPTKNIERLEEAVHAEATDSDEPQEAEIVQPHTDGSFMPLESEPEGTADIATAVGGGGQPPTPPRPPEGSSAPDFGPEPEGGPAVSQEEPAYDRYQYYQPAYAVPAPQAKSLVGAAMSGDYVDRQTHERALDDARRQGVRRAVATGIVAFVASQWVARNRQRRFEADAENRLRATNEQLAEVSSGNARLQQRLERMGDAQVAQPYRQAEQVPLQYQYTTQEVPVPAPTTHFEQPMYPPVGGQPVRYEQPFGTASPAELYPGMNQQPPTELAAQAVQPGEGMPQVVGEDGQQIVLEPGQHLERRGWYSVIVDEHGREVPGAMQYGNALQAEQRPEQAAGALAGTGNDSDPQAQLMGRQRQIINGGANGPIPMTMGGTYGASSIGGNILSSGQVDPAHQIESQAVDMQHRLSQRQNPILATLANPVLWLAFALLVIAYFIAALI